MNLNIRTNWLFLASHHVRINLNLENLDSADYVMELNPNLAKELYSSWLNSVKVSFFYCILLKVFYLFVFCLMTG